MLKKNLGADYEHFLRSGFSYFQGQKKLDSALGNSLFTRGYKPKSEKKSSFWPPMPLETELQPRG
jgi:hypothetical protein